MPIIIDGWNFIRNRESSIDDSDGDSIESIELLVDFLKDFQKTRKDPITVVFDSRSGHLGLQGANTDILKVVAAKNADSYIKKFIDNIPERQRAALRVVSSDGEVYYYARRSLATPVKCEEFWARLRR